MPWTVLQGGRGTDGLHLRILHLQIEAGVGQRRGLDLPPILLDVFHQRVGRRLLPAVHLEFAGDVLGAAAGGKLLHDAARDFADRRLVFRGNTVVGHMLALL